MIDPCETPNFRLREARCSDGTAVPKRFYPNVGLLFRNFEVLRAVWNVPINLLSCFRTEDWNAHVGGARHSRHLTAEAGDIVVAGVAPRVVADTIERLIGEGKMQQGGLGRYRTFTHYDVRRDANGQGMRARWGSN